MVVDTALRLLQLVALALPAMAIYMQVLAGIYQDTKDPKRDMNTGLVSISVADEKIDFALVLGSLSVFLLSSFPLIATVLIRWETLLTVGIVLISLALFTFLSAVVATLKKTINTTWRG